MEEDRRDQLVELFAPQPDAELAPDVMGELQSMLRLHSIAPQELFYKWESYSLKMGADETRLDLNTARAFKTDLFESLERENRSKVHTRAGADRRTAAGATPRNVVKNSGDVFGMLDGVVPHTPGRRGANGVGGSSLQRKAGAQTPGAWKTNGEARSTPLHPTSGPKDGHDESAKPTSFTNRPNAGQVIETLNQQLECPDPPIVPPAEPRVKLTANTDLKKFGYRPMAMHLSEASEVLDDRIDEFAAAVQAHHNYPDSAFGSAASQDTSEVIAVGRIASDSPDARLNRASLVLETSRRVGAGLRVPLRVDAVPSFEFFPGQIVALRGVNASGDYFSVKEILSMPLLPVPASRAAALDAHRKRLAGPDAVDEAGAGSDPPPLAVLIGAGPYTADDNLDYQPLHELCDRAAATYADVLVLTGPLLDVEHPLVAAGDIDLPADLDVDEDSATLTTAFRGIVSPALQRLASAVPTITILLVPSVRDAISRHVSWPQEQLPGRKELGLPRQVKLLSNPVTVSVNEVIVGVSAQDVLSELRRSETFGPQPRNSNLLARLSRHVVEQRHFFPLFPPLERRVIAPLADAAADADADADANADLAVHSTGAMLDASYLKLGEWLNVRPDVLILPSSLPPFAKVIESVLVINPGTLSKRKAPGSYARISLYARASTSQEQAAGADAGAGAGAGASAASATADDKDSDELIPHRVFERARVDIIRI